MEGWLSLVSIAVTWITGAICCRIWYKIGLMRGYGVWLPSNAKRKRAIRAMRTLNKIAPAHEVLVKDYWKLRSRADAGLLLPANVVDYLLPWPQERGKN